MSVFLNEEDIFPGLLKLEEIQLSWKMKNYGFGLNVETIQQKHFAQKLNS